MTQASWSGSNRLFGWMGWREMNPQWWSLGLLVGVVRNNLHVQVTFARRSYSVQLWRGES